MPIYKPSELRQFLNGLGIYPKKSLSQNFLIDGNIIRKIVAASHISAEDIVLEVGPGPGSLTEALLENGATVLAVERDRVLAQALERFLSPENKLKIFCEDILNFPVEEIVGDCMIPPRKAKVVANLPYHLTTPILVRFVPLNTLFSSLVLMVQDEVARRFTAKPGSGDYSSFTLFLNFYSTPRYAFSVSKSCFYPVPKVDSAIVILDLKEPPKVSDQDKFFEMTRTAFKHRRKMLRASLRDLYSPEKIMRTLEEMGLSPQARPEELSLEQFLLFFERLQLS